MGWNNEQATALLWPDAASPQRAPRAARMVLFLTIVLIAVGIGMIYSASAVMAQKKFGDSAYFLKRQMLWLAVGMVVLIVVARMDLRTLRALVVPLLLLGLLGLILGRRYGQGGAALAADRAPDDPAG